MSSGNGRRVAAEVVFDEVRGHIALVTAEGYPVFDLTDLGPHLAAWSWQGADLDAAVARALAAALESWADLHDRRHTAATPVAVTDVPVQEALL